jgi:hypothetical protein
MQYMFELYLQIFTGVQCGFLVSRVPKLVIQKSAGITSELEVTICSGAFQKLHQLSGHA